MASSSKAARRELPQLVDDLEALLWAFEKVGGLNDIQNEELGSLRETVAKIRLIKLGIPVALSALQYQIDDLGDHFWTYDKHRIALSSMLGIISEFLTASRLGIEPPKQ